MQTLGKRAGGAALWSALEIAFRYGAQLIVTIILARLLAPTDFGLIAVLLIFTSIGALLADAGFGTALIQRQQTSVDDEATVFYVTTVIGLAACGLLWLCADAIAHFFHEPALLSLTRTIAFVLPLGSLGAVPDALLTKRLDFKARTASQVIASVLSGGLAIFLAWSGFAVWALVWQVVSAAGVRAVLLWFLSGWKPVGHLRLASLRALFGFGGYMLLANLLNVASTRLQSLLIGKLFDAQALGYYTLAQNAQQVPTSFIGALLGRVGLPAFSTIADQPDRLRDALRMSLQISLFLFIPCMVGLAVTARPLISTIYGARWDAAAPMLTLLALAGALWPMHVLNLAALGACGRADRILLLQLCKDALGVTLVLVASPFGPTAIAAVVLLSSLCSTMINAWYSQRMLNYGLSQQLLDQKKTWILSLLAALPAWGVLHWTQQGPLPTIAAISIAGLVYIGGAMLVRHCALYELLKLLRNLVSPPVPLFR